MGREGLMVVEILERQGEVGDKECVKFFWDDLCESNGCAENGDNELGMQEWVEERGAVLGRVKEGGAGVGRGSMKGEKENGSVWVDVDLVVLRLEAVESEVREGGGR